MYEISSTQNINIQFLMYVLNPFLRTVYHVSICYRNDTDLNYELVGQSNRIAGIEKD